MPLHLFITIKFLFLKTIDFLILDFKFSGTVEATFLSVSAVYSLNTMIWSASTSL